MSNADHQVTTVRELGYERRVCAVDGLPWPCPDARARAAAANDPDYDPGDYPTAEDPPARS